MLTLSLCLLHKLLLLYTMFFLSFCSPILFYLPNYIHLPFFFLIFDITLFDFRTKKADDAHRSALCGTRDVVAGVGGGSPQATFGCWVLIPLVPH